MLSYELVKLLHLVSVFVFISFAVLSLLTGKNRWYSIVLGVSSLSALIFGFGLIGVLRSGMNYWMIGKVLIWVAIMAMVGVVNKRFPKYKHHAVAGVFILVGLTIFLAVYKPF